MGIGQPIYADYRYRVVDYLSPMYMNEYVMASKKPTEIATYDTILYPTLYPKAQKCKFFITVVIFILFISLLYVEIT